MNFSVVGNTVFFESRNWWENDIYWLPRSYCFGLFGDGKYDLFFSQKTDEKMIFTWSFWAFHDISGPEKYGFSCSVCFNSDGLKWQFFHLLLQILIVYLLVSAFYLVSCKERLLWRWIWESKSEYIVRK